MVIRDLWGEEDEARLVAVRHALATGDLAGALFAVEGASDRRSDDARRRIERWAERVEDRLAVPGTRPVDALRAVLVNELHLGGDVDDVVNPRQSALSVVVAVRSGLPILVSAVWMLVGRLADVAVDGLALPGHFVVRVGGPDGEFVDAWRLGKRLSLAQVREIVERHGDGPFSDDVLEPATDAAIVERVLRNLSRIHQRLDDQEQVFRVGRMLAELRPDSSEHRLQYAELCDEVGAHELAESTYRDVMHRFGGTREALRARQKLASRSGPRFVN